MSDSDGDSLPDGWTATESEREEDPDGPAVSDKYDPRQPELFERTGADEVQIHAAPIGGNQSRDDAGVWQVGIVEGSVTAPAEIERTHEVEDRAAAMDLARDLMAAYEEHGDVEAARDAVESAR